MSERIEGGGEQGTLDQLVSWFNGKVATVLMALSLAGCGGRFYTADMNSSRVFVDRCHQACDQRYQSDLANNHGMTGHEREEANEEASEIRQNCRAGCWKLGGYD